jgi:hypothetical protein
MINGETGPNSARMRSQSPKDRFDARAALLPIRSGVLAHREGRKLDRHLGNLG